MKLRQALRYVPQNSLDQDQANQHPDKKAGLNLNIFAAVSGVFKGRSTKTTDTKKDGSSHSVENREEMGHVNGAGAANLKAVGDAHSHERYRKGIEAEQSQQHQQIDHLGLGAVEDAPKRKK
jgi:hypothetical protein